MFDFLILLLLVAIGLTLYRFLKGPTLSDRVVAFDTMGIISISFLIILSLYFKNSIYLDIALVLALIGFLTTAIFGRFIEKGI